MYTKTCPYCNKAFETKYVSDKYCTPSCKETYKIEAYKAKWANGRRGKPDPRNAFRLFGLEREDDYGWG